MGLRDVRASFLRHPVRLVPLALAGLIALGTGLLMLPFATAEPGSGAPLVVALTAATSAACTAGYDLVDTGSYWSTPGHVVIAALTQIGGIGIMASALLLLLTASRRLGLRNRLVLQAESVGIGFGNARRALLRITVTMICWEAAVAVLLTGRLWLHYDVAFGAALWDGVFHAIQSFNNSGFSTLPGGWSPFVADAWMCLPPTIGVIAGSLGFPVLTELRHHLTHPETWSVHTRLTVGGSLILLAVGFVSVVTGEWNNPDTLGPLAVPDKLLAGFVQGTIPRSGGLATVSYAEMRDTTDAIVSALMFVGGGSASTAGGIKVTTFFLLAYVIWAEIRGEPDVVIGRRRIAPAAQRQALTVALLGIGVVALSTLVLAWLEPGFRFYRALFEVTAAWSTAGLNTANVAGFGTAAQYLLAVLVFLGRVGTIGAASALALRTRHRLYRYPEERPLVG
ncbi:potassium transporter TrkG [Plantactinospora sp. GCM10030261]|uniref:potassium transporter TrkG n=1 Tax=Plantactinospora sp. GCM10030261 TaxID=3273420 RepID=UPI0036700B4D